MSQIIITGIGVISSLGRGVAAHTQALQCEKTGILKASIKEGSSFQFPFGKIDKTNNELIDQCDGYVVHGTSRTDALAKICFQDAIKDANLSERELKSKRTAFISASTVGGMCNTMELYNDAAVNKEPSEFIDSYPCSIHLSKIVKHYKISGPTTVLNTACSSSANAIMLGAKLLRQNKADIAIVGGVDSLSEFTVRGFNSLGILSLDSCKPFDENRDGLNLGEAAAYLVLRRKESTGTKKYAEVSGWANTSDSFHASSLNETGEGIVKCIQQAMDVAKLDANQIDFINAHGTGTINNDLAELTAISKLFSETVDVYSTKSYTGHTLGAAGALESVLTIIGLQNQEVYKSLRISKPLIIENTFKACQKRSDKSVKHALSNSFGFNGNCTSLIISVVS